jgi:hypothetical protein
LTRQPHFIEIEHIKSLQIDFDCRSDYKDRLETCVALNNVQNNIYIYILATSAASWARPQNNVYVRFMLLFVNTEENHNILCKYSSVRSLGLFVGPADRSCFETNKSGRSAREQGKEEE